MRPEVEYGWIEPAGAIDSPAKVYGVRRFWQKPNEVIAQALQLRGCLWNSFVMIASVRALLDSVAGAIPELYRRFDSVVPLFGTSAESEAINELYEVLSEINFSHQVLVQSRRLDFVALGFTGMTVKHFSPMSARHFYFCIFH